MVKVLIKTNFGNIELELDDEKAPITTKNFVDYANNKHYDGLIFHRVINGFMIQGGGMTADMKEKKSSTSIQNEAKNGLSNMRGTIAMARTRDPHSATNQFFINLADNHFLNQNGDQWGYAVFGKVSDGMDCVDKIAQEKTGSKGHHDDVPVSPVTIEEVVVIA